MKIFATIFSLKQKKFGTRLYDYRSDRIKKLIFNYVIKVSIFGNKFLNVDLNFYINQLEIDYLDKIFFETLEIFLEAVFLFSAPDLATCIRID